MTFYYRGIVVGQVSAEPSQLLTKPMSGEITLLLGLDIVGEETQSLPYTTTIGVYGYPLSTPWITWGDWTSHGDTIFPMAVASELPDIITIGDVSVTTTYAVLANPLDVIDVPLEGGIQKAYPFEANKRASVFTMAQYQLSNLISYIPLEFSNQ